MTSLRIYRALTLRTNGSTAAEFGLVLPLLLLFLLGMIDVGRYMWTANQLEKATQMGARMAVVTNMVPGGLANANYGLTLGQGAPIPPATFGAASCTETAGAVSCSCVTAPCPVLTPYDSVAFNDIVTRMRAIAPAIDAANVSIAYTNSGLGFAGDPSGSDVAPIVTVTAADVDFVPLIFQMFGVSLNLPAASAALTLEDGAGSVSN
jgi:hypothetical protein